MFKIIRKFILNVIKVFLIRLQFLMNIFISVIF